MRICFLLILFALTNVAQAARSVTGNDRCERYLVTISRSQPKYLIGVLAEMSDQRLLLGFTKIVGPGHTGIIHQMRFHYGPLNQVKWIGEVEIVDGKIQRANENSESQIYYLARALTQFANHLTKSDVEYLSYDRQRPHLNEDFVQLRQKIDSNKSSLGVDMFRHDILWTIQRSIFSIDHILISEGARPLGKLALEIEKNLAATEEAIRYFCRYDNHICDDDDNDLIQNLYDVRSALTERNNVHIRRAKKIQRDLVNLRTILTTYLNSNDKRNFFYYVLEEP